MTIEQPLNRESPLLTVSDLSVSYNDGFLRRTLVDGVSFDLSAGETIGIVGESGSGKSMTALALLGLLPRRVESSGSVRFAGQELLGQPERALRRVRGSGMSLLLQDPGTMLNPVRRCVTHVEEGLRLRTERRRRSRRLEALRRLNEVGIDATAARRYPFQVSGGMAQRVAIAAALAADPDILIADEPTTALDVTTQRELLDLLRALREQRRMAMVLITHDLRVASELCDRLYVMYAGSLLEQGAPDELSKEPLHPYTHGLLRCEPEIAQRRARLNTIPGSVPAATDVGDSCAFAARCTWCIDQCRERRPDLRAVRPDRWTACIRIPEIEGELVDSADERHAGADVPVDLVRPEAILTVNGLQKRFPQRHTAGVSVLQGIDLVVGAGESVGVVGQSGSGKSTLARCIVGLETPTEGNINLVGLEVSDYARLSKREQNEARRAVQIVFQNPYSSLNPSRTIGSALAEAIEKSGDKEDSSVRIQELLEQVGLPAQYADRRPNALSGGERQRVAIARGLAVRPKLLVCDEPTSALDVSVQAHVLNLLRGLQDTEGLALLFITHNLAVASQMTDHLYVMSDGCFVEQGPTSIVLSEPGNDYTRRLLASVPGEREPMRPG